MHGPHSGPMGTVLGRQNIGSFLGIGPLWGLQKCFSKWHNFSRWFQGVCGSEHVHTFDKKLIKKYNNSQKTHNNLGKQQQQQHSPKNILWWLPLICLQPSTHEDARWIYRHLKRRYWCTIEPRSCRGNDWLDQYEHRSPKEKEKISSRGSIFEELYRKA